MKTTQLLEEIKLRDNDRLSALTACLVDSDLLVIYRILTDILVIKTAIMHTYSRDYDLGTGNRKIAGQAASLGQAVWLLKSRLQKLLLLQVSDDYCQRFSPCGSGKIIRGEEIGTLFLPGKQKLHTKRGGLGSVRVPGQSVY